MSQLSNELNSLFSAAKDEKTFIIACDVFRNELEYLCKKNSYAPTIIYLEQGLHELPATIVEGVQKEIDKLEEEHAPERIFLAYGLCGRGLSGVHSKKALLIVPKVHDCVPLLLGTGPDNDIRPRENAETYWLSAGWSSYSCNFHIKEREERYKKYVEDYGQDSADYLMEVEYAWKTQYKAVCFIRWEAIINDEIIKNSKAVVADMGLPYTETQGSSDYLEEFLRGGGNKNNFFHIEPYFTLDLDTEGKLTLLPVKTD